jgi:molecular chaperone IbpA
MPEGFNGSFLLYKRRKRMNKVYYNSPFFIGLEKTLETLENLSSQQSNYPPYNIIETDEHNFIIEFAVSGFSENELKVVHDESAANRILTVKGERHLNEGSEIDYSYYHRGISKKNFEKKFTLGEYVEVSSVKLRQGILEIKLVKNIPEAKRPKEYKIES